ncbi:MAG TPA: nucleoside monophosphate kinase [bacterium (Candidatus Stahlbacteria)]|nr:nucleoside monophosphate kinase [Candidatus Stahlbacteria bacterium]
MVVVLLGPPGAGKGTQASLIADHYNLRLISMGDFLRKEAERGSEIGKEISSFLQGGHLVPDEIIIKVVEHLIGDSPIGIILDGFPRNLKQAESLVEMLKRHKGIKLIVIEMYCCDEEVIRRLSARRQCPECNRIYNLNSNPPKEDEVCDLCKVKLYQRDDDQPAVIRRRLLVYHQETKPIIDYFKGVGEFHQIAIDGNILQVFNEFKEIIDAHTA